MFCVAGGCARTRNDPPEPETNLYFCHYSDVIMRAMASKITSLNIIYSVVYSGADQRKHQSSASLAFVRGIHRWPVNSLHKGPVTRKMFPFDDVILCILIEISLECLIKGSNNRAVFKKMTGRLSGNTPLPETKMSQFTHAYMLIECKTTAQINALLAPILQHLSTSLLYIWCFKMC